LLFFLKKHLGGQKKKLNYAQACGLGLEGPPMYLGFSFEWPKGGEPQAREFGLIFCPFF